MPIYLIGKKDDLKADPRVIEADNKMQALRFVAADTLSADVASATDVARLMARGAKLEVATTAQRELSLPGVE
jgi:hypothetical protein